MDTATVTRSRLRTAITVHVDDPGPVRTAQAAALLNSALGKGFVDAATLSETAMDGKSTLVRAMDRQGQLLGAATARILDRGRASAMQARLRAAGIKVDMKSHPVGELTSSAVAPAARGRGIGTELVRVRMEFLRAGGCRYVVCASWVAGHRLQTSAGLLRHAGFKHLGQVPLYWAEERKRAGYLCAACGADCVCAADLMRNPAALAGPPAGCS